MTTPLKRQVLDDNIDELPNSEMVVCNICDEVADVPVTCPSCMNNCFCRSCISKWLNSTRGTCPSCNVAWLEDEQQQQKSRSFRLVPNRILLGLIDRLPSHCLNEDCPFSASLKGSLAQDAPQPVYSFIVSHLMECQYVASDCKYKEHGCTIRLKRNLLKIHEEDHCEYAPTSCDCGHSLLKLQLKQHRETECPRVEVRCDCGHSCIRRDLDFHKSLFCPLRRVSCDHSQFGCSWTGNYQELTDLHLGQCPYETLKGVLADLHTKLDSRAASMEQLRQQAAIDKEAIARLEQQHRTDVASMEQLRQQTAIDKEAIARLEKETHELKEALRLQEIQHKKEMDNLEESLKSSFRAYHKTESQSQDPLLVFLQHQQQQQHQQQYQQQQQQQQQRGRRQPGGHQDCNQQ